jgi:hypothetical protein
VKGFGIDDLSSQRYKSTAVMKISYIVTIVLLAISSFSLAENKVFSGGRQLDSGQGEDQKSSAYEMKGPYALRWTLMDVAPPKSENPYWTPRTNPRRNAPWVSVAVYDANTGLRIAHEAITGRENQMTVPQGGKHYLVVTSYDDLLWTIWGLEGILGADGLRALRPADTGGGEANRGAAQVIAALKATYSGRELEERLAAVKLIESRSSSAEDFGQRWQAYSQVQGW